jgi:hypothetical protein
MRIDPGAPDWTRSLILSSCGLDNVMGCTLARLRALVTYSSNNVVLFGVGP